MTQMIPDGSLGAPGQCASGPGRPWARRRVRYGIEAAIEKYSSSAAEDLWHRLDALDFMNRAMLVAGIVWHERSLSFRAGLGNLWRAR